MTKREATRRLQHLALEAGRKRNYYVKRALVEFLDRNQHLLEYKPTHRNGLSNLNDLSPRGSRVPEFAQLIREG
jgi:hypothetical protein